MKKGFNNILKVARPLLTLFEYAVSVLIIAVTAHIVFGSNLQTWIITAISVVLAVSTYAIWYSDGVERGENTAKVFNTTLRFNTYAKKIRELQLQDKQREFCKMKNEQHRLDLIIEKLAEYELNLKDLTSYKEQSQIARESAIRKPKLKVGSLSIGKRLHYTDEEFIKMQHRYTPKQLKVLNWLSTHEIKFEKIVPKDLTKSTWKVKGIKPKNTEAKKLPSKLISKILWGVALGLLTASIAFTRKGAWTMNETIQVVTWAFSISFNIYTSVLTGYKSVTVDRFNYFTEKIELTTEFFGFIGQKVDDIEQELQNQLRQD